MSFANITPAPGFYEWLPIEYKDLVDYGPYKNPEKRPKVTDMGKFKEIIELVICLYVSTYWENIK